jgi:ABC-type Fe3+-hydroxamate transport system substrate-binding protein
MFKLSAKIFTYVTLTLLVLGAMSLVAKTVLFPVHVANKIADTTTQIVDKTLNADNVVNNYEWFKQQAEDNTALLKKTEAAEQAVNSFNKDAGPREKWTFEDKIESARLAAVHLGLQSQREDLVATYNARSKMANRSIFKQGVPSHLE